MSLKKLCDLGSSEAELQAGEFGLERLARGEGVERRRLRRGRRTARARKEE